MSNGLFWIKKHKELLAVCDKELIGKKMKDMEIRESFYKGELVDGKKLELELKMASNINLIGKNAVKKAIDLGMADKNSFIEICGVPHLILVKL